MTDFSSAVIIKYHSFFSFCYLCFHTLSRSSQHFCKFSRYLECVNVISSLIPKNDKRDKSREIHESRFLEVYIHAALASVLSSSLSTEHHKAGAGERSILGDRNKRGWQLKQKSQATLFYDAYSTSCIFIFRFRAIDDLRSHLRYQP